MIPEGQNLVITCTSNVDYIDQLKTFLNSMSVNSPGIPIVVRLINVDQSIGEELLKIYEDVSIIHDNPDISNKPDQLSQYYSQDKVASEINRPVETDGFRGRLGWVFSQEAAYSSNAKFKTIDELLSCNNKCVVYMDVDTIVRGDITGLIEYTEQGDVGTFVLSETSEELEWLTGEPSNGKTVPSIHAGILIATDTEMSKQFYRDLKEKVMMDCFNPDSDEDEFERLLVDDKYKDLKLIHVDRTYKDSGPTIEGDCERTSYTEYSTDSLVWSGQGRNKEINTQYIDEMKKYTP